MMPNAIQNVRYSAWLRFSLAWLGIYIICFPPQYFRLGRKSKISTTSAIDATQTGRQNDAQLHVQNDAPYSITCAP